MSLTHLMKYAAGLRFGAAVRGGRRFASRYIGNILDSAFMSNRDSFGASMQRRQPQRLFGELDRTALPTATDAPDILAHRFDLLGSGVVHQRLGMSARGAEGHRHDSGIGDSSSDGSLNRLNRGNRKTAREIRSLLSGSYVPIDWQLDFKSGFRWRENTPSRAIIYGHVPGADIKVPWELARLQHLPRLALAALTSGNDDMAGEVRDQILDFVSVNPPGWGVNWACTMDVAIRAANIVVACDLMTQSRRPPPEFIRVVMDSIRAHGRHIAGNLEYSPEFRGNHYLADIAGLAFCAAFLPGDRETDTWLAFAIQEIRVETQIQFHGDGGNFEASTCYHRLSLEMVVWTTALVLGLPEARIAALKAVDPGNWRQIPDLKSPVSEWREKTGPFDDGHFSRLINAGRFCRDVTKPDGCAVQIGDNDSGRFLVLSNAAGALDFRDTVGALTGICDVAELEDFTGNSGRADNMLAKSLSKGLLHVAPSTSPDVQTSIRSAPDHPATNMIQTEIPLPGDIDIGNVTEISYPDFGLFIWRSGQFHLSVRCGQIGQNGAGGHAHNDQLSLELQINGEDWLRDPGSYLYTPAPALRDRYRSVRAHAAPRVGEGEPSRLDFGMFRLEDNARARLVHFGGGRFHGVHYGYGKPVFRQVVIQPGLISILDGMDGELPGSQEPRIQTARSPRELRDLFEQETPFSPGYGQIEHSG